MGRLAAHRKVSGRTEKDWLGTFEHVWFAGGRYRPTDGVWREPKIGDSFMVWPTLYTSIWATSEPRTRRWQVATVSVQAKKGPTDTDREKPVQSWTTFSALKIRDPSTIAAMGAIRSAMIQ